MMKRLETDPKAQSAPKHAISHLPAPKSFKSNKKAQKPKRRKSALRWFIEEAKDVIEDIFD